jgi:CelD/BcsL family acetyltransferase involved in cellulose biosynthesis
MPLRESVRRFSIEVVTRPDAIPGEALWNELLKDSSSDSLFLTWEWVTTWWSVYGSGSRLHMLVARAANGDLLGIAPLKASALRVPLLACDRFEFIGSGSDVTPEYLDFIVRSGYEDAVIPAFLDSLMSDGHDVVLDLRSIRPGSSVPGALVRRQSKRGRDVKVEWDAECPRLALPASVEQFKSEQSRNYRKKVGEYQRRCERELALRFRVSATLEELKRDMCALVDLHHRRWKGASRAFRTPEYCRFHETVAERFFAKGNTRMLVLERGSQPIAALYCYHYGGHFLFYQGGWDPEFARYRPGLVMMDRAIQQAIGEHAHVFDFLRGLETYKARWATERRASLRATAWNSGSSWTANTLHGLMSRAVFKLKAGSARSFPSHTDPGQG